MSESEFHKASCQECGQRIEYPALMEFESCCCPHCNATTLLQQAPPDGAEAETGSPSKLSSLDIPTLLAAFDRPIARPKVSLLYRLSLVVVSLAMVILPLVYVAMIAAAAYGVHYWATHFTSLLQFRGGLRVTLFMAIVYLTPLLAGSVMVLFMIKPLFARRGRGASPLALNPGAEPLLFTFVTQICRSVGAPFPTRIDVDCQLNASASFRRGSFSFLGNDLVLTLGMPLVSGLNVTELAGVIAHEFGHFSQGVAMRLTYIIRSVNAWFARVIYERDAWDEALEEWAQTEDSRLSLMIAFARLGVWFSRVLLKGLMYAGHGIGCFMLREMEYDADLYEIRLSGSGAFEATAKRIHTLGASLQRSYQEIRASWNLNRTLPDNLPTYLTNRHSSMERSQRTQLEDTLGLHQTGLFDTHPSDGDRIRRARRASEPGVFQIDAPATCLFSNFEALSKQVTLLHYEDDLELPIAMAKLQATHAEGAGAA